MFHRLGICFSRPFASLPSLAFLCILFFGCAAPGPPEVESALALAGDNRPELEEVLDRYQDPGEGQKLEAARFLIANMEGHGYVVAAFFNEEKEEVAFNALDYPSFKEAQKAMDALEKEHGTLDYRRKEFIEDLKTVSADYLIENIDLAFQAWQEKPWARDISFETFCEHILPYRGSNEPINPWRKACCERYANLMDKMETPGDMKEAARLIQKDVHQWVRFDSLYYLHPTDQGFEEMNERGKGRCEDISNMMAYAFRANEVPSACDYTPHWADRDNNHAWEVVLDVKGRGKAGLSNRAAKVYRKTFSRQKNSLGCLKGADEEVPRWLAGKTFVDVTAQYCATGDVILPLDARKPKGARFAYLCVFNGGEWKAIHWGLIKGSLVTFTKMGCNIAYLPAYYVEKELVPAGPPFILTRSGEVRPLRGSSEPKDPFTLEIAATAPATPDADTRIDRPRVIVKPGKTYELFYWGEGDWISLGKEQAGEEPVTFSSVPGGSLFWLVEEESRRLERIFTLEGGRPVFW